MAAGNKDVNVVGEIDKPGKNHLSDIPRFTPFNCNFFKQTISSKEQTDLLSKDRSSKERLTSNKTHPKYDRKRYRQFLSSKSDQKFLDSFNKGQMKELSKELEASSKKLVYPGDVEKSINKQNAEDSAIIEEMKAKSGWEEPTIVPRKGSIYTSQVNLQQQTNFAESDDAQSVKSILKQSSLHSPEKAKISSNLGRDKSVFNRNLTDT